MWGTVGPTMLGFVVSAMIYRWYLRLLCRDLLKRTDGRAQSAKESGHLHLTIHMEIIHGLFGILADIRTIFLPMLKLFHEIKLRSPSRIAFGNKGLSCKVHPALVAALFLSFGLISTLKLPSFEEVTS